MNKRPRSISVISWLFVAAGAIGLAYHATELKVHRTSQYDVVWVCLVRNSFDSVYILFRLTKGR